MNWKTNTAARLASNYPDGLPNVTVNFLKGFPALEEEAKKTAEQLQHFPEMIKTLQYIAGWDSYKDHPIGKAAIEMLKKLNQPA